MRNRLNRYWLYGLAVILCLSFLTVPCGALAKGQDANAFSADLFRHKAEQYNNDLALVAHTLSWKIEREDKADIRSQFIAYDIGDMLFGCYNFDSQSYMHWWSDSGDGAFAIGRKIISVDEPDDTTVLVVVGRGTQTTIEKWSDFTKEGSGPSVMAGEKVNTNISAFVTAMWDAVTSYVSAGPITTPHVKMLITGHSLGGAMANLFGAKVNYELDRDGIPWLRGKATRDDIHVYTFGAIKVLKQDANVDDGYENIHNIYNYYDSFGPNGNKGILGVSSPDAKFGHTDLYYLKYEEDDILKNPLSVRNHDIDNYQEALEKGLVRCSSSVADPVLPRLGNLPMEFEILRYAQRVYDEITQGFTAESYMVHMRHDLQGHIDKLNNAKQFGATYSFHTNIASTLISLELGLLMEDPQKIASAAASAGLDVLMKDVLNINIDMSLEDFVFSQASSAAKAYAQWDIYDTMKRAEDNGGKFASYEDAKLFLRRYLENRMNLSTLRMAEGYYEHLMNRDAWTAFGDLFARVAVSDLSGKLGGDFLTSYAAGKLSTSLYSYLDIIGQQINERYASEWISTQKQLIGEIDSYFSQNVFALDLNAGSVPKRFSGYAGNWACDAEGTPSLTIAKKDDQYFASLYWPAQDRLDRYVLGGITTTGKIRFLNVDKASVLTLELLDSELSVQIDTYEKGFEEHSQNRYHWQEYAWVGHWVNTENPETVLDITSNGDGTLHLSAHFAPDLSFAFDFPPVDYEMLYFDTLDDPFPADMYIDGKTGILEFRLFEAELNFGWMKPDVSQYERFNQYAGSYYFTTENPPDLTRFGWIPYDEPDQLTEEEVLRLFARLSETPLMAASGAGAWEGRLKINADGTFTGFYGDADADMVYQSFFSGRFSSTVEQYGNTYRLWVEELSTNPTPGTQGTDEYGDPVTYTDAPFFSGDGMVLTLPGTPNDEIPEMVQGEIGGTLGEWEDYSRFITLTRLENGWGFFADPADPPDGIMPPNPADEEKETAVSWTGIWQASHGENRLYIFREEGSPGDYQVIHTMTKNGETRAIRGSLYFQDEITMDYDVPGILHGAIVGDPNGGTLSLTPFSAVDERMTPWMPVIEGDYERIGSMDDPDSQIPASVRDLIRIGLDPVVTPTPAAAPVPTAEPVSTGIPEPASPDNSKGAVLAEDDVCTITYLGKAVGSDPHFTYGPAAYYRLAITNHTYQPLTAEMTFGTVNGMKLWDRVFFREDQGYTPLRNYAPIPAGETKTVCLWPLGVGYGYRQEEELVNAVIGLAVKGDTIENREYTLKLNMGESYQPPRRTEGYQARTEEAWQFSYEIPADWEVYYQDRYTRLLSAEPPRMYDRIDILPPPSAEEGVYHIRIQEIDSLTLSGVSGMGEEALVDGFPARCYYEDHRTSYYVDLGNGKGLSIIIDRVEKPREEAMLPEIEIFIASIRFLFEYAPTPVPTATPTPSDKLPKNVSRLPNGNLRYDDGLIAFEAPDNATIFVSPTSNAKGTVYPENTTILSIRVLMPVPVDSPYNNDFVLTETQQKVFNSVTTGIVQLPPDVDAAEFVWTKEYAGSKNTGYTMFAGRAAICHTNTYKTKTTYVSIPLSGNRIFELVYSDYPPDAGNKMALDMFLNTLEIRDSLFAEPPAGPVQTESPAPTPAPTATPVPTAAPDLSAWKGYWMTHDRDMAEMIITENGDGTLHANAMFLPAGDSEATLTPQEDGSMRFESQYGHLIGSMTRQADGGLRLVITGGTTMEDEEATEYQGYFAQGFTYYPAAYEDMWYQTPEDAAATEDDWLGNWTAMQDGSSSALQISKMNGQLTVDVTLGRYHFSGPADMGSDTIISVYADDFYCMLILNKKLNRIAMMETDSSIEEVYDITGNPYYGILIFQKASDNSFSATPDQIDAISDIELPETLIVSVPTQAPHTIALIPVPDKAGYMQVPVSRVDATSWIVGKDPDAYTPFRMIDGEETTSFQFSTQTTRLGQAYLYFDFDGPVTLDELWMKNGFWRITDGKDQYTRNSRVKKMTIFVRYAGNNDYQMLKDVTLKDDKARKDWKVINMLGVENVTGVQIRIDEIYKGSKFTTDVCISEIMFVQNAE